METENRNLPSSRHQTPSSGECKNLTSPLLAAQRARILFGCYRTGEANDPETYVAAIAAMLTCFPSDIVHQITDPKIGVASKSKFLPSVAEIREACEKIVSSRQAALDRLAHAERQRRERQTGVTHSQKVADGLAQLSIEHHENLRRVREAEQTRFGKSNLTRLGFGKIPFGSAEYLKSLIGENEFAKIPNAPTLPEVNWKKP